MDDLWHLKGCQGLNRHQSSLMPASLNQIDMLSGPLGHPFVQQEVCVIERTIRQESLGANLLNFGLQGSYNKSVRGDVGNPLLAFVPGSQHQVRSSHQSIVASQSPHFSPNPQGYQLGSVGSPCVGSWPGHVSNMSAGNCVSGGSSGLGMDSSINIPGREVTLSMSGRELNLTHYSRMGAEQDYFEPNLTRPSGVEMPKNNVVQYNANDVSGQGPYPQWLTISSRQRGQNVESHTFASGATSPRAAESSLDSSDMMSSLIPLAPALMRGARVVCINHDTGQRIGGELYLTQLGLLGVTCSCHGSHMSVAKFTQHVGIYSTSPGNVVAMDGTGESLVQWRKTLFSLYGIKVPCDNQGWNWSDGAVSESGPTKYKAVVTQSWQKEVDVSYNGTPSVKSRLTQICDASVSPSNAATLNYPLTQNSANLGLLSNSGDGCIQNSRETILKSFERALRGSLFDFGSCPSSADDVGESVPRCQGLSDLRSCRNSSTECINFISDSQQLMASQIEQQVAVERQIGLGSRSLLKGLDLTWSEGREPLHYDKDNSSSSFELKLGQPSQQAQSVGPPVSSAAVQMRGVMQRGLDTGGQQNLQNSSGTSAAGLHTFSGCEGPSNSRFFSHPSFANTTDVDPFPHRTWRVDPNRGIEASGLGLGDHSTLKGTENVSTVRFEENLRGGENVFNRDAGLFPTGMRRWPGVGLVGNSFKVTDGPSMNSEHPAKRWAEEAQLRVGDAARPITQGHQDLDTVLGQEWMSKSQSTEDRVTEPSGTIAGREGQACRGENMIHVQRSCSSPCKEVCREEKEQFAYEEMITTRGTREGQGCVYLNNGKSTATILKGRILSKAGEGEDVCMKEANQEGNRAIPDRHRMNRAAGQEPITHDCSSPSGGRHRSLEGVTTRACTCGAKLIDEHSNQGFKATSLAGSADGHTSVTETSAGIDKRFVIQGGFSAKSGSKEYSNDAFQWKEMGGIFVPGNEPVPVRTQNDMSSPRALAEDMLADTAVKSTVPVSSKVSDKQQSVSDICSKSFENGTSRFPDTVGEAEEVSNAHSVEKNSVGSGVVDEASGIGMCSSSDGADMGLMPNLNMSSNQKHASPSSGGSPSLCDANEGSRTKVKTRSRGDYAVKGPVARYIAEGVSGDTGKVEKKRKRTMKWRWLDAAIGSTDDKRQKLSPPVNVAENFDSSQKLIKRSDVSNCFEKKNLVGCSPPLSGEDSATKAHNMIVTQGDDAALNPEHGMEDNVVNCKDSLHSDKTCLTTTETLVIRVPQGLNRKKAKRSGRSKAGKIKSAVDTEDHTRCNESPFSDTVTVDPAPLDVSILKESAGAGGFIPELTLPATKSLPRHCSTLHTQTAKPGRVVLRRPSPRSTTRMVSLNDIMSKPEVVAFAAPKDHTKSSVVENFSDRSAHQDGSRGFGSKERPNACAPKNGVKEFLPKDRLEASSRKDRLRTTAWTEGPKELAPTYGVKVSRPKEASKTSATEGLKVRLSSSRNGLKVSSPNGGWKANPEKDEPEGSFAKEVSKVSTLKDGLKPSSGKDGSKGLVSDESLKASCSKRGSKVSAPIASVGKDNSKESAPKNSVRIPTTMDSFEVAPPRADSKNAATKNSQKFPVPKMDTQLPTSRSGLHVSVPKDFLKSKGAEDSLNLSSRKGMGEASGLKNRFKPATLKDRLKTLASRDALQHSFSFDIDIAPVAKDRSNASVLREGFKSFVPMDSLEAKSKAATEGTGSRKADSSLAMAAKPHDRGRLLPQIFNAGKESKTATKPHKQEVQKVRSLYELISEKTLPRPGTGVFEFQDEGVECFEISEHNSAGRSSIKLDSTLSVPVHFSDSKCLVPRGERSPRVKPSKMKNSFLLRHKAGNIGTGTPGAEPVEVVVGRKFSQDMKLNIGTAFAMEKVPSTDARLCPVPPRIWSLPKGKTKCEVSNITTANDSMASSLNGGRKSLGEDVMAYNGNQSRKRVAEPDSSENAQKKRKFVECSRTSQLRSGLLKLRHSLPTSAPTSPTTPFTDVIDLKVKANKMRSQIADDDINISGRKKRCQRPKLVDCQVPEGVVECCVCGSSISEFFNQIVCCSLCPVKVHQACYGVKRIPNSAWLCRTCKATASHPICVLCGYGGGAMTRAQKAMGFVKGLVKVWQATLNPKEKSDICAPHSGEFLENGMLVDYFLPDHQHFLETRELSSCSGRGKPATELSDFDSSYIGCVQRHEKPVRKEELMPSNTVSSGLLDSTVVQWVHMVCALWMPGTRCLNFGTMGVFDVSGVAQSRRKLVCSICNRKGGACIQCRVEKCGIPFHAWCAHEKGLLQSEIVEDGSDQVGFYGKCVRHGQGGDLLSDNPNVTDVVRDEPGHPNEAANSCARTEGYAGKLTLEQRALRRRQANRNGSTAVAPEQVAAWLRINERKTCKARRFLKSANSDQKTDHREYLRFKQEQGWRRLSVYKSGIHALGLYTAEFIARGEMVVEYVGEIVGLRVADKREADYHSGKRMQYQGACYLFRIDRERIIDATRKGGIARFVNHSCSPNCVAKVICVKNQSKVVFFAQRDIYAGEEVTYDYQFNFEQEGDKIPCFCGSANCRGTLN